jgi:hypothetical protein
MRQDCRSLANFQIRLRQASRRASRGAGAAPRPSAATLGGQQVYNRSAVIQVRVTGDLWRLKEIRQAITGYGGPHNRLWSSPAVIPVMNHEVGKSCLVPLRTISRNGMTGDRERDIYSVSK